jgi:group I intron endonuclease
MGMGIYKIINVVNNKFYVGSAVNFSRRKARHFSELRHNKHNNRWLQASWNKHGESAFVFAIVEEVQDKRLLVEVENRWLKEHVGKEYCYNIGVNAVAPTLGWSGEKSPTWGRKRTPEELAAQSWKGKKHSEESKQKIRGALKGHHVSTSTRAKISATLSGEGNFWHGKKRPDHSAKVSKPVVVTDPAGKTMEYASISILREEMKLKPPTVNRALKSGKPLSRGPYKGWSFKYLDSLPNP